MRTALSNEALSIANPVGTGLPVTGQVIMSIPIVYLPNDEGKGDPKRMELRGLRFSVPIAFPVPVEVVIEGCYFELAPGSPKQ